MSTLSVGSTSEAPDLGALLLDLRMRRCQVRCTQSLAVLLYAHSVKP